MADLATARSRPCRTPPLLVDLFATLPIVTAPLAVAKTGAGRATVQRNLALKQTSELIREMSGQRRYRGDSAAVSGRRD